MSVGVIIFIVVIILIIIAAICYHKNVKPSNPIIPKKFITEPIMLTPTSYKSFINNDLQFTHIKYAVDEDAILLDCANYRKTPGFNSFVVSNNQNSEYVIAGYLDTLSTMQTDVKRYVFKIFVAHFMDGQLPITNDHYPRACNMLDHLHNYINNSLSKDTNRFYPYVNNDKIYAIEIPKNGHIDYDVTSYMSLVEYNYFKMHGDADKFTINNTRKVSFSDGNEVDISILKEYSTLIAVVGMTAYVTNGTKTLQLTLSKNTFTENIIDTIKNNYMTCYKIKSNFPYKIIAITETTQTIPSYHNVHIVSVGRSFKNYKMPQYNGNVVCETDKYKLINNNNIMKIVDMQNNLVFNHNILPKDMIELLTKLNSNVYFNMLDKIVLQLQNYDQDCISLQRYKIISTHFPEYYKYLSCDMIMDNGDYCQYYNKHRDDMSTENIGKNMFNQAMYSYNSYYNMTHGPFSPSMAIYLDASDDKFDKTDYSQKDFIIP